MGNEHKTGIIKVNSRQGYSEFEVGAQQGKQIILDMNKKHYKGRFLNSIDLN